jgi:hypothetical protein
MSKVKRMTATGHTFQAQGEIHRITVPRETAYSDEKKRLLLACLKENFGFLDFWEKAGEQAKAAAKELGRHRANDFSDLRKKYGPLADEAIEAIKSHYQCNEPLVPVGGWKDHTLTGLEIYSTLHTLYRFDGNLGRVFRLRMWGDPAGFLPALEILDPATKELPADLPFYFYDDLPGVSHKPTKTPMEGGNIDTTYLKPSERLLRVDLSKRKTVLMAEFEAFLDRVGNYRKAETLPDQWRDNYKTWEPDRSRERAEAWHQLKVWRMRKERIPFIEIARGLKITEDAAKKAFYKAYERTQGRAYEPDRYRQDGQKLNTWDMTKTCQTCPDRRTCSELCPEILRFADQGTMKNTKEFIGGEKDLLENGGLADYSQNEAWDENEAWEKIEKHWTR